jgi:hypothetical protein
MFMPDTPRPWKKSTSVERDGYSLGGSGVLLHKRKFIIPLRKLSTVCSATAAALQGRGDGSAASGYYDGERGEALGSSLTRGEFRGSKILNCFQRMVNWCNEQSCLHAE